MVIKNFYSLLKLLLVVINGANIGMSDNFNLHYRPSDDKRTTKDSWIFGVLTAAPFLAGGIL